MLDSVANNSIEYEINVFAESRGVYFIRGDMERICEVINCNNKYSAKGFCIKHYARIAIGIDPHSLTRADPRPGFIEGSIAKIPLGINAVDGYAIVDKEFAWLDKYKWRLCNYGYPSRTEKQKIIKMHSMILPIKKGMVTDHINRIKTDNRRVNLREVTQLVNNHNKDLYSHNKSGASGVTLYRNGKWHAQIYHNNKKKHLGYFLTKSEAIKARKEAEHFYWPDKYSRTAAEPK